MSFKLTVPVSLAHARLMHELAIWRRAWKAPVLWWRDDDCRTPDWRLDRLLQIRKGLPLTLAVIPDCDLGPIARRLATELNLTIAQHGVDHVNRLRDGGPRSEFAFTTAQATINAVVASGRTRLSAAGLDPSIFVPPWNEASHRLVAAIQAAGYSAFSAGKFGGPIDELAHVGAQIDILRWNGAPRFRGRGRVLDALRIELESRRLAGRFAEPIGILTHHLAMDEAAWKFLDWLVQWSRPNVHWGSLKDFLPAAAAAGRSRFTVLSSGA